MATKKPQPEQTAKFIDLEPVAPASKPADLPTEGQVLAKGTGAENERQAAAAAQAAAQARASTFNEDTRREEEAKALAGKIKEEKALALTVDELMQGIDLALENMAAGMTQSEAVRRAAETIRKQKAAPGDIPF